MQSQNLCLKRYNDDRCSEQGGAITTGRVKIRNTSQRSKLSRSAHAVRGTASWQDEENDKAKAETYLLGPSGLSNQNHAAYPRLARHMQPLQGRRAICEQYAAYPGLVQLM